MADKKVTALTSIGTGTGRGPDVLLYTGGTTTEELTFSLVVAAASATHNANDVLHINAANVLTQVGASTIKAVSDAEAATITTTAAVGNAAGSILVVA